MAILNIRALEEKLHTIRETLIAGMGEDDADEIELAICISHGETDLLLDIDDLDFDEDGERLFLKVNLLQDRG